METKSAVSEERIRALDGKIVDLRVSMTRGLAGIRQQSDRQFKELTEKIEKLHDSRDKLQWLVIAAVVSLMVKFVFDGGMSAGLV